MTLTEIHHLAPVVTLTGAVVLGLLIGSFLNVVIYRLPALLFREWRQSAKDVLAEPEIPLPERFNLAFPRSHCPNCKAPISALQNIPVLSYLVLGGRCANCKTPISKRYPVIEAITGALSLLIIWRLGVGPAGILGLVFLWALICLTMIDIDTQLLPDNITLPLLWVGLLANTFGTYTDLNSAIWGAAAGYLSLWCVYWVFKLVAKKEGMGYGDFKLLAALGAWMGWQYLPVIIMLSSLVGAVVGGVGMVLAGRDKDFRIPFGPYLAGAGLLAFLWGQELIDWYFNVAGLKH